MGDPAPAEEPAAKVGDKPAAFKSATLLCTALSSRLNFFVVVFFDS